MLSGSKNRKTQGSRRMMEDIAGEVHLEITSEKADDMQYDSRKSRRRRRSKKEMGRNNDKENAKGDNDKGKSRNEKTNEHDDETLEESSSGHSSAHLQKNQMSSNQSVNRKESLKKETNTRSKNLTKGKKGKAASKDSSNVCQTCGEEFDSRNKLHKHLGNTGHAWLKYRRVKAIGWSPIDTSRNCGLGVQLLD